MMVVLVLKALLLMEKDLNPCLVSISYFIRVVDNYQFLNIAFISSEICSDCYVSNMITTVSMDILVDVRK